MPAILNGLTAGQAKERLQEYGPNILPEKPPPSSFSIFISQFKNPLVYILLAAGLITFFLGDFSDTAIIFFVVLVNTVLGFFQEKRASSALESLKKMIHPKAKVIRDGKKVEVNVSDIVPGDLVQLISGEKVPADGVLLSANRLFLTEAMLTGESVPVGKNKDDEVYMGTIVSSGEAVMEVTKTGAKTEMGKIAVSVQTPQEDTPLTKQLKIFSSQLTMLVIVLTLTVFVIGALTGKDTFEIFETSVALAVSSIPEGLLVALTVVLAVGMQRILSKNGLVRSLISAETLGGVTTLCVDKTGTLTYGNLEVVQTIGDVENVCSVHFTADGDPEMSAASKWFKENSLHSKKMQDHKKKCKVIDSIPFTSENRFYASLIAHKDGSKQIYVSGAPEQLLKWSNLSQKDKSEIDSRIKELTQQGRRVIAIAMNNLSANTSKIDENMVNHNLDWIGVLVYSDPVRKGVEDAFIQTKNAGIKTIVITGDYAETALSVMNELGMGVDKDRIIVGEDLEKMGVVEIAKKLKQLFGKNEPILFARTRPDQKLIVINALKDNGEVVAMMGDGVNDAPALHRADIGIVVGEATDVAKESADLVLLDSSFETIVAAIKEGRGIFDNIRKVILYLMSDSFEEIIAVVGTIILAFPLPVTAAQVLWINIVSDGFPHLSLTVDPKDPDIMNRLPRNSGTKIVSSWMKFLILIVSLSGGIIALLLFIYYLKSSGNLSLARSIAFATLGINSLVYVFSVRTLTRPFWKQNPFENKWLNIAVIVGLIFQFLPFSSVNLRMFFELQKLSVYQWGSIVAASVFMFIMIEGLKAIIRLEWKEG